MMATALLVAARLNSTRLKEKSLLKLGDKTVVEQLIARVRKAKLVDKIVLCTSTNEQDAPLLEIAKETGIESFTGSEDDVLDRFINAAESFGADRIVRVTGDNPLTDPEYIDRALETQDETGADFVMIKGLPAGTAPEVITLEAMKRAHSMASNPDKSEYMRLYFIGTGHFKPEAIKADDAVNRPDYRVTLDTPEDYETLKAIFSGLGEGGDFSLKQVVAFLDENPGLLSKNSESRCCRVTVVEKGGKVEICGG